MKDLLGGKPAIDITVNLQNSEEIKKKLERVPDEARKVIKTAVNDTAKQARKKLDKKAKETYAITTPGFDKAMKIKKATNRTLTAIITAGGRPVLLSRFKMIKNTYVRDKDNKNGGIWKGEAVKAKVLKKSPLEALINPKTKNKAFLADVKAGSKSVTGILVRKGSKRNPTEMLYGPSVPQMLEGENVYDIVYPGIKKEFQENVEKRIRKILSK